VHLLLLGIGKIAASLQLAQLAAAEHAVHPLLLGLGQNAASLLLAGCLLGLQLLGSWMPGPAQGKQQTVSISGKEYSA
jgi:hypothetical protein